jgi:hypothetical protein
MIANDPNETPEHMIQRINRRRTSKLILMMVGLVGAIVVAIGATALIYSDGPKVPTAQVEP